MNCLYIDSETSAVIFQTKKDVNIDEYIAFEDKKYSVVEKVVVLKKRGKNNRIKYKKLSYDKLIYVKEMK